MHSGSEGGEEGDDDDSTNGVTPAEEEGPLDMDDGVVVPLGVVVDVGIEIFPVLISFFLFRDTNDSVCKTKRQTVASNY